MIIAIFSCLGKTSFVMKHYEEYDIVDHDLYDFKYGPGSVKDQWHLLYAKKMKWLDTKFKYVLVNAVPEVLPYLPAGTKIVYPDRRLKHEYLGRAYSRTSSPRFMEILGEEWDTWIDEIEGNQQGFELHKLNNIEDYFEQWFFSNAVNIKEKKIRSSSILTQEQLDSVNVKIIPLQGWPSDKKDPTQYNYAARSIEYQPDIFDPNKDIFLWLIHEKAHAWCCENFIFANVDYPNNKTEKIAFTTQFYYLLKSGMAVTSIKLALGYKFDKYPILESYLQDAWSEVIEELMDTDCEVIDALFHVNYNDTPNKYEVDKVFRDLP